MPRPRSTQPNCMAEGALYTQVRERERRLEWVEERDWRGGLTRRAQEDVHQVLIEDEGGRPLREQVRLTAHTLQEGGLSASESPSPGQALPTI